ncbi:hypothetical protein BDV26DRAFT_209367 [Aspergillus bertholletiae]|uniref:Uncharacterized protein n=1 Tax=Aspergillus bertholletiae TaxID=1226010 RepID=A0A5N7BM52_9EURO|nr:hypothetical protein BDV26DRAFT_209367 [Aspergillus bertholletiae]
MIDGRAASPIHYCEIMAGESWPLGSHVRKHQVVATLTATGDVAPHRMACRLETRAIPWKPTVKITPDAELGHLWCLARPCWVELFPTALMEYPALRDKMHLLIVRLFAALVQASTDRNRLVYRSLDTCILGLNPSLPIGPWIYEISNTLTQIVVLPHRPFDE